jgi:hypothetical protein
MWNQKIDKCANGGRVVAQSPGRAVMIIRRARVQNYKSIDDSGWVDLGQVTCLVGKNESGKTAFLQAITKFNPVAGQSGEFDATLEYPRKRLNGYERGLAEGKPAARVVSVEFEVEQKDLDELPGSLDGALNPGDRLVIYKTYENKKRWDFSLDEAQVVKNLLGRGQLPEPHSKALAKSKSVSDLRAGLGEVADKVPQAAELVAQMDTWDADPDRLFIDKMARFVPKFFYFDDYSIMRGRVSVADLIRRRDADELEEDDRTFLAFLRFVGAELEQFQSEQNFEALTAKLEAASNEISDELFQFWTQNQQLAVRFTLSGPDAAAPPPLNDGNNLHIRVYNERHRVTVPFDQRSRGFVWFFSFLVYFSQL